MKQFLKRLVPLVLGTAVLFTTARAGAEEEPLRLGRTDVARLARARGPDVTVSAKRIDVSRGQLVGAQVWLRQNPWLEVGAGPRFRANDRITDAAVSLAIPLEIYGVRGLEIDAAESAVARDESRLEASRQSEAHEALLAYYRALRAEKEVEWATQQLDVATALLRIAERRREAGDLAEPDVAMMRIVVARARRASVSANSLREAALSALRVELGLAANRDVVLTGGLTEVSTVYAESLLQTGPAERPDVIAAERAVSAARADIAAEERTAWPVPVLRSTYEREESANVFFLSVGVPLPLFQRNQGGIAEARGHLGVAEAERDGLRRRVDAERRAARARYQAARDGASVMESEALPGLEAGLRLVQRSFETGHADITNVLVVQRELADTRREYLDSLLELAEAGLALERALGRLP